VCDSLNWWWFWRGFGGFDAGESFCMGRMPDHLRQPHANEVFPELLAVRTLHALQIQLPL
jgi:hypothetical protein